MGRYVDIETVELKGIAAFDDNLDVLISLSDVRKALQMTPAADVVEVVRCRDCRSYCNNTGECNMFGHQPGKDGYCSKGKRYER